MVHECMILNLELFGVLRAFSSLVQPSRITYPKNIPFHAIHAFLLECILLNAHFHLYPPSEQYQKLFWKFAIHHLESIATAEDSEVDPRIYEHYLTLLPQSSLVPVVCIAKPEHRDRVCPQGLPFQTPPAPSYVSHFWKALNNTQWNDTVGVSPTEVNLLEYETITLLESRTTIESGTTGLRTWLASFVLSDYLTANFEMVKDKRILELGCGAGFLGIILARLQQFLSPQKCLWLTDINETVLARCRDNLQMPCNGISTNAEIHYQFLDWSHSQDPERLNSLITLLQKEIDADLILGADIIFDPSLILPLVMVLHIALQPTRTVSSKTALVAVTIRNEETFNQFIHAVEGAALQVQELLLHSRGSPFIQDIDNDVKRVKILRITL